ENGEFLSDATSEEIEAFYDYLVDIGFDEKYSFILKILIIQKLNNYKNSIELFDNEYGLRDMYANLLKLYRAKDEIDEEEPAMFRRRQEQINKAIGEAVELLDINHKNKFLEFVYRGFDDEKLLAIIKDSAKAEIQELIKQNTQINDENKIQELSKMLFGYIFEDEYLDQIQKKLIPLFGERKSLSHIDDLSALLVKCDDKIVLKLLKFLCKINRVKNLDYFYEQFTGGYNKNTEDKATKKLVQIIKDDGFESEVLFEFYLKQFKHNDNYFDFKDNPFSQILVEEFENIKKYEKLLSKKAYRLFEEQNMKQSFLESVGYGKSKDCDDE
ncbi:MAG: hypothetical protein OIF32_12545, partial [Campylobacterales bacterium]|nr:hypothetical protein [Campylobacterales bacterium]